MPWLSSKSLNQFKKYITSKSLKYSAFDISGAGNRMIYQIVYWVAIIADSVYVETSTNDDVNSIKNIYSSISISLFEFIQDWKTFIKEKI